MKDTLKQVARQFKADAQAKGLLVYPYAPRVEAVAFWEEDWNSFLDFAVQAQARILYLMPIEFSVEEEINEVCRDISRFKRPDTPYYRSDGQLHRERIHER